MKKNILKLFIIAFVTLPYWGCKKPKTYDITPAIEFRSLTTLQNSAGKDAFSVITISFTDGDGDIGFHDNESDPYPLNDTNSIYYNDFIVTLFNKQNGVWVKDTIHVRPAYPGFSGRMPNLTPDGDNKNLKGEVSMKQFLLPGVVNDTMRYEVYIFDRALHQSNTITTSDLVYSSK